MIAIVTGGSRGLGRDMAQSLAAKGRDVILTYNSRQGDAQDVVAQIEKTGRKAVALQLDVGDSGSFEAFAQSVTGVLRQSWNRQDFDFLVNNAGVGLHAPFMETTEEQFDRMMNIHFKSVFFLTQKLLPLMKDGGRIVNISSGLARFSFEGYSAYAAMKGGVETLSRFMAKELGPRGIAVNVVAPGAIATDFGGGAVRDNAELNQMLAGQTALGRVGLPADIGGVVASLLSDEMRWVNGQRIEVSGGFHLWIRSKRFAQSDSLKAIRSKRFAQSDSLKAIRSKRFAQSDSLKAIRSKRFAQAIHAKTSPNQGVLSNGTHFKNTKENYYHDKTFSRSG